MHLAEAVPGKTDERQEAQPESMAVVDLAAGEVAGEAKVGRYRISTCDYLMPVLVSGLRSHSGWAVAPHPVVDEEVEGHHLEGIAGVAWEAEAVDVHLARVSSVRSLRVARKVLAVGEAPGEM